MVTRNLMFKFYCWFLLAMTATAAITGAVIYLLSYRGFQQGIEEWALSGVRLGRDIAQNLLLSGISAKDVGRILAPVAQEGHFSFAIVGEDGRTVLLQHPRHWEPQRALPDADDVRETLSAGSVVHLQPGHRFAAALPLALPSGERGVFYLTMQGQHWRPHGVPYRLLVGLGVILVTGWLLIWPLASHLARPLKQMAAAADALGQGDLSARITLGGGHRHGRRRRDEIGRLSDSFNKMAENLQRLVVGHKQLLADISHELRSPLARLRIAVELARQARGQGVARYLDSVDAQADTLDGMIEELLFYSRLEAAPYELRPKSLRPRELVEAVTGAHEADALARDVSVEAAFAEVPAAVRADRRLLLRALGNVLRNAIAYTPNGATVRIEVAAHEGRLRFSVTDEGPGVAHECLEQIFLPFVRTDTARTRSSGGVGLGLAIARRCMEAHGGGATAEPAPDGRGLTVHLWLPLAPGGGEGGQ